MGHWKDNLLLKIANFVGCLGFLGSNIYIYVSSGGVYRSGKETYFTPSPHLYLMWPLIHFLLLGCIMFQFTDHGKQKLIDGSGWRFPMWTVLSIAYVHSWAQGRYAIALFLAFLLIIMPFIINTSAKLSTVGNSQQNAPISEAWISFLVISYLTWALFLLILSAFEAFGVDASTQPAGVFTKVFVFLGLWLIELIPSIFALNTTPDNGAVFYSIPVTCILFAIFGHQRSSSFIHWTALTFTISAFGALLKNLYRAVRQFRDDTLLLDTRPERLIDNQGARGLDERGQLSRIFYSLLAVVWEWAEAQLTEGSWLIYLIMSL